MEKFGIFELLDALAALTPPAREDGPPEAEEPAAETQPAPAEKRTPDAAFAPPSYGEGGAAPANLSQGSAYGAFLARHEKAKERAKK